MYKLLPILVEYEDDSAYHTPPGSPGLAHGGDSAKTTPEQSRYSYRSGPPSVQEMRAKKKWNPSTPPGACVGQGDYCDVFLTSPTGVTKVIVRHADNAKKRRNFLQRAQELQTCLSKSDVPFVSMNSVDPELLWFSQERVTFLSSLDPELPDNRNLIRSLSKQALQGILSAWSVVGFFSIDLRVDNLTVEGKFTDFIDDHEDHDLLDFVGAIMEPSVLNGLCFTDEDMADICTYANKLGHNHPHLLDLYTLFIQAFRHQPERDSNTPQFKRRKVR